MPAYPMPACGLTEDTAPVAIDNLKTYRLGDGTANGASGWTSTKNAWTLHHSGVTWAEYEAILASYNANRASPPVAVTFTWPYDGLTKSAYWQLPPTVAAMPGGFMLFNVSSSLAE